MTPFAWIMELLDAVGSEPRGRVPRQCPAHRDAAPSLSMHERDGRVMIFCHAGCGWREILAALRCSGSVLHRPLPYAANDHARLYCSHLDFPMLETGGGHPAVCGYRLEAVHDYGTHLLERWRHPVTRAKDLRWWTKRDGTTIPGLLGVGMHELPMYRETDAKAALCMGESVLLVESESSVDALSGFAATTWPGGANAVPMQTVSRVLGDGSRVIIIPDMDEAGLTCAAGLRAALPECSILAPGLGEDAKDLYTRVGKSDFEIMVKEVSA